MMRREFSKATKAKAFGRAQGRCEKCCARLFSGNIQYDHVTSCALGGDNSLENCEVLCRACHNSKTGGHDVPKIAKAKRQQARHIGAKAPKSRPLPGTRASGIRKRMNGNVERW